MCSVLLQNSLVYHRSFVAHLCRRSDSQRDSLADDDGTNVAAEIFVKPIFHKTPTNLSVAEGQIARLDSIVIGRPNPDLCWYHNGTQVRTDRTHKIVVNQDGVNSLIFQPASLSDAGTYQCVATNGGGKDSFEVSVYVTRKYDLSRIAILWHCYWATLPAQQALLDVGHSYRCLYVVCCVCMSVVIAILALQSVLSPAVSSRKCSTIVSMSVRPIVHLAV